jgi:micrococcal nuclease
MPNIYLLLLLIILNTCGCTASKVYVDSDKVSGLGAVVEFPTGKIIPIEVKSVVSGNIIELTNGEMVSYIGVYIPQLYNIAEAAKALNEKLIKENEIRLEFDTRQRDRKGQLLAYVFTTKGKLINAEIIREGLAEVLISPPNTKHKDLLLEAEKDAKQANRGIWSEDFKK